MEIPDRPISFAWAHFSKISKALASRTRKQPRATAAPSLPVVLAKMTLFILTETSAGYALLKAKDKKLLTRDTLVADTENAEDICSL